MSDPSELQRALWLHQQGRLVDAGQIYEQLIRRNPKNHDALHFLSLIKASAGQLSEARKLMEQSLSVERVNPAYVENYATMLFQLNDYERAIQVCVEQIKANRTTENLQYVLAVSLHKAGRLKDAQVQFDKLLVSHPNHLAGVNDKAAMLAELGQYEEALSYVERALRINPRYAEALLNKGNVLVNLKRYENAIAAYEQALKCNVRLADAYLGCGVALRELGRHKEALVAYDRALSVAPDSARNWIARGNVYHALNLHGEALSDYDRALSLDAGSTDALLGRGSVLRKTKRFDEAATSYDMALAIKPDLADAWIGRGNVLRERRHFNEALSAYDIALTFNPDLAEAWVGRGNVLFDFRLYDEALAACDKALTLKPSLADAWLFRGIVYHDMKRYSEAIVAFCKASEIKPDFDMLQGLLLDSKMHLCDWQDFDAKCERIISSVRNKELSTTPFAFISISSSPTDQLELARLWVTQRCPPSLSQPISHDQCRKHDRIRIAYVSADFHQHATSVLMAGMFECHNKARFDVTAISIGPDDASQMRERLKASFERFIDARALSDDEIVSKIKNLEIDILVDLKGFTQGARPELFARRPAPIQVSYLGYPGTMGAEYMDYLIADRTIIPEGCRAHYAEKIVHLPNSYQVNDSKRLISDKVFTRPELGLPDGSFVFCCFNNNYKILPNVFDSWMRILGRTANSVLWLLEDSAFTVANLRKEAAARGIGNEHLVFSKQVSLSDHLARIRSADLFLDTLPCNAHTTASDALWAGLPILTQIGDTFAGRVAASLLHAIGLPELIAETREEYEKIAIEMAANPVKLKDTKRKIAENRLAKPLFDTRLFTHHIEMAFEAMYERYRSGLPPDHMAFNQITSVCQRQRSS